jgi:hypothetical protein
MLAIKAEEISFDLELATVTSSEYLLQLRGEGA